MALLCCPASPQSCTSFPTDRQCMHACAPYCHGVPPAVAGCLQCLSIMAVDLDSEQAPQLLQTLSPELAMLVSSPQTSPSLSAMCFKIMAELTSALASLSGAYQRQVCMQPLHAWHGMSPPSIKPLDARRASHLQARLTSYMCHLQ